MKTKKLKNKLITRNIQVPLYPPFLHIWYGTRKEINEKYYKINDDDSEFLSPNREAQVFNNNGYIYCVFNKKYKNRFTYGTIAHEALHVVYYINTVIGETTNGCEKDSYLLDWVVNQIHKIIKI